LGLHGYDFCILISGENVVKWNYAACKINITAESDAKTKIGGEL
jgi:hypothetical protein